MLKWLSDAKTESEYGLEIMALGNKNAMLLMVSFTSSVSKYRFFKVETFAVASSLKEWQFQMANFRFFDLIQLMHIGLANATK